MSNELVPMSEAQTFDLILKQAEMLCQSKIVPAAYRKQSADIVAAGLAGRAYGWDTMTAMRNFHVIEGTASIRPEAMLGLVRQAGHSVTIEVTDQQATATGKRSDTGDVHASVFTMRDAEAAGLAKKRNWSQYRSSMLTWRAVSQLCRVLFPDVVLGAGYVPEEIGGTVDGDGEIIEAKIVAAEDVIVDLPVVPYVADAADPEVLDGLREVIAMLDGFQKDELSDWWKAEQIPSLKTGVLSADEAARVITFTESIIG
jgi:hypothetical protein